MKRVLVHFALGLVAAVASADPTGGTSLAAPGACAQPDPQLVTQTVHGVASVAGRPSDDFLPVDLDALTRSGQGPLRTLLGDVLGIGTSAAALPPVAEGPTALPRIDPSALLDPLPVPGPDLRDAPLSVVPEL